MKRLFKKLHKAVTVTMCIALVVETVNLTGLTVSAEEGTSVSGNSVSGNAISAATQERLDSLQRSAQTANTYADKTETQWNSAKLNLQRIETASGLSRTLYSTTLPKVSNFANQARGSMERAKAAYDTALANLSKWNAFFVGEGALDQAEQYVDEAKKAAERAQNVFGEGVDPAAKVAEITAAAQTAFDSKKVVATFFVLKDSSMFASLSDFGNPNRYYVEVGQGELVDHNATSPEPYSLLDDYASKTVAIKTDLDSYIVSSTIPSRETIKNVLDQNGIAFADDEEVVWYIIKTESGIIHIDGVIRKTQNPEPTQPQNPEPTQPQNPEPTQPQNPEPTQPQNPEAEAASAPVQATAPAVTVAPATPIVEEVEENNVDTTVIEDETPALSSEVQKELDDSEEAVSDEVITIEEEETPLAAGAHCWIHWLILILTLVYTVLELLRSINRNKKINELKEELEEENAVV